MWTKAVKDLIQENVLFCDKLSTFDFGDGMKRAAIFTGEAPEESFRPCITMDEAAVSDFGCRGYRGGVVRVELTLWADRSAAISVVSDLADELWRTVHWRNVSVDGYRTTSVMADPPERVDDMDKFVGYFIPAEITYMENRNG